MQLTKFGHACVRVEHDEHRIVIDPGTFTDLDQALAGAEHVLITHEHPDHIDDDPVLDWLGHHVEATVRAPQPVINRLAERVEVRSSTDEAIATISDDRLIVVHPEEDFELAGFRIRTLGGQHALIHPQIPVVDNIGYLINDVLYHPGDSFIVPEEPDIHTVLVPLVAPWAKLAETLDFIIALRARQAVPIHDALLSEAGRGVFLKNANAFAQRYNSELTVLADGEGTWVG